MNEAVVFWKRTDLAGLERLVVKAGDGEIGAESTILTTEDDGFRLDCRWRMAPDWRAVSLELVRHAPTGTARLRIERSGSGWIVDGAFRPDLDGAAELDLTATPFCNTFPIKRTPAAVGGGLTLDVCSIEPRSLSVTRSRQRYVRIAPYRVRYIDLGLFAGFEADLLLDQQELVVTYEHLFEREYPSLPVKPFVDA